MRQPEVELDYQISCPSNFLNVFLAVVSFAQTEPIKNHKSPRLTDMPATRRMLQIRERETIHFPPGLVEHIAAQILCGVTSANT